MAAARARSCGRVPGELLERAAAACRLRARARASRSIRWPCSTGRREPSGWRSASAAASIWRRRPARHPDVGFLGVEPFINGVAKLLRAVEAGGLANVRILMDDARLLLEALPAGQPGAGLRPVSRPVAEAAAPQAADRQPAAPLAELARVVRPGGELRLATDDADYARWMLAAVLAEPRFVWTGGARRATGASRRPTGCPPATRTRRAGPGGRRCS